MKLTGVVPLLQVSNLRETIAYYEDCLGFSQDFVWEREDGPIWAGLSRGEVSFMLTRDLGTSDQTFIAEKGNGVAFYILVDEIETLYDELSAHNALIVQDMITFGGRRQFTVGDPNGYVITFSEPYQPPEQGASSHPAT